MLGGVLGYRYICRWIGGDLHGGGGDDLRVAVPAFLEFPRQLTVGAHVAERDDAAVVTNGALRMRRHTPNIIKYIFIIYNNLSLRGQKNNNPILSAVKD